MEPNDWRVIGWIWTFIMVLVGAWVISLGFQTTAEGEAIINANEQGAALWWHRNSIGCWWSRLGVETGNFSESYENDDPDHCQHPRASDSLLPDIQRNPHAETDLHPIPDLHASPASSHWVQDQRNTNTSHSDSDRKRLQLPRTGRYRHPASETTPLTGSTKPFPTATTNTAKKPSATPRQPWR